MIGIAFLLFIIFWTFCCGLLSWGLSSLLPASKWRPAVGVVLFVVLTSSLFIDEVIGNWQFQRLCRKQTVYIAPDARGRSVYLEDTTFEPLKGFCLHGWIQKWRYVDATTGETVIGYNYLHWDGGWFMRALEWGNPFFYNDSCVPENRPVRVDSFKALGINRVD